MVMEYVQGALLFDVVKKTGGLGERTAKYIMKQLFEVLSRIHGEGVAHRDVKLENVMVDDQMNVKIIDFGFAAQGRLSQLTKFYGTSYYMSPEIRNGQIYDGRKADIFSSGVLMYILVVGMFPFAEANSDDHNYSLVASNQFDEFWQ